MHLFRLSEKKKSLDKLTFSEVDSDFRSRVGSIVRKTLGSVSSSGSHETLQGSISKYMCTVIQYAKCCPLFIFDF